MTLPVPAPATAYTPTGYTRVVNRTAASVLFAIPMIIVIVVLDVLLLRDEFWPRLGLNVGIVALAGLVYVAFLRH